MLSSVLDHRLLRQFLAVADAGSVRGGAAALNMSQPPLTNAIKRLEDGLGAPLFERQPRGMVLTPAGAVLADEARLILVKIDAAATRAKRAAEKAPPLRIGFVSAALNGALAAVLKQAQSLGGERPVLMELTTPEQVEALTDGQIDVGLLHPPIAAKDIMTRPLGRDPFCAAIPETHSLAEQPSISFVELLANPLVLFPPEQGPVLTALIERLAEEAGCRIQIAATARRTHSQLALVSSGVGLALVPEGTAAILQVKGVSYRPISDTRDRLFLDLAFAGAPNLAELFADCFAEA